MGGQTTKMSADLSSDVVTNVTMDTTQDCTSVMDGDQVMLVSGSGNVFSHNTQTQSMSVDMKCVDQMEQQGVFSAKVHDNIQQWASDQTIAGLGWMDSGKTTVSASVVNDVTTNVTFDQTQNCMMNVNGHQIIAVTGDDNVVAGNAQEQTFDITKNCMMQGGQYVKTSTDLSDIVNQHQQYVAQNPFAFIPDAIEAAVVDSVALLAVMFIVIVSLVFIYKYLSGRRRSRSSHAESPPTPPASASAAPE